MATERTETIFLIVLRIIFMTQTLTLGKVIFNLIYFYVIISKR